MYGAIDGIDVLCIYVDIAPVYREVSKIQSIRVCMSLIPYESMSYHILRDVPRILRSGGNYEGYVTIM